MAAIPTDGRITSLTTLTGALTGSELMYIVSPGNVASGVSYNITTDTLATFFSIFIANTPTIITSGSSYPSVATDTRILVDKTSGSATSIVMLASNQYSLPVLIKDLKGDSATNPITITFSGGQLFDGLSDIVINNPYGYVWLNPLASGGWYDASF